MTRLDLSSPQPGDGRSGPLPPIPLTVITGFLGAGKSSLLNRLLKDPALAGSVVIVNEFGEIGLDHLLVEQAQEGMLLLASGCLCCTVRGDLVATLEDLLRRRDNRRIAPFTRVLIETTGLADPAPILQVTMGHRYLGLRYRLEGIVTLVDAVNGLATLADHPEAVKQATVADRLVLSKTDLCGDGAARASLAELRRCLARLNPLAPILDTQAALDAPALLDCGLYNPATKLPDVARWLQEEHAHEHDGRHGHGDEHDHDHHHAHHRHGQHPHDVNRHSADIRAFSFSSDRPVGRDELTRFLDLLRLAHGPKLLRLKGIVATVEDPDQPLIIHCVQHVLHPPFHLPHWPDANHSTRLVCILKGLDHEFINRLWSSLRPA